MSNKKIILASASPRRKDLLKSLNLTFEVIPAQIDENIEGQLFSNKLIEQLALDKVKNVCDSINYPAIVIGSDTVVVINKEILGKPKDADDAFRMLKLLSGKTHDVVSAIAIIDNLTGKVEVASITSKVKFREISDSEINNYINTQEPMDKAGAYAIQGLGAVFVESISGCYSNIVGISIYKLADMLKEFEIFIL